MAWARAILQAVIVLAFVLGLVSTALRRRKVMGLLGMSLASLASILGGSGIDFALSRSDAPSLGLDWFALNVLLLAALFVPMERLWPLRPAQSTFRPAWTTDTLYFLTSHSVRAGHDVPDPRAGASRVCRPRGPGVARGDRQVCRSSSSFSRCCLSADLAEYFIHRAFHVVPALWRFHAIHHSSIDMDWLAGSRLHILDVVVTRAIVVFPLFALGFDQRAVAAYLVFVSFHAVFIHANVRFDLRRFEPWIVTPRFHHWHHAKERAAIDKNFAVHLPWIDRLFGTAYEPAGQWPRALRDRGRPGAAEPHTANNLAAQPRSSRLTGSPSATRAVSACRQIPQPLANRIHPACRHAVAGRVWRRVMPRVACRGEHDTETMQGPWRTPAGPDRAPTGAADSWPRRRSRARRQTRRPAIGSCAPTPHEQRQ